jgi:hypothetical protein
MCASQTWKKCNAEKFTTRIRTRKRRHLIINEQRNTLGEFQMTKIIAFTAAFALFVPVAIALIAQAAQIVA